MVDTYAATAPPNTWIALREHSSEVHRAMTTIDTSIPHPTDAAPNRVISEPVRLAYSAAEVAPMLGCTRQHVCNMIASGELRSVKLGRRRLIPVSVIDELLAGGDAA